MSEKVVSMDELFVMMKIAEDQQAIAKKQQDAVKAALDGLRTMSSDLQRDADKTVKESVANVSDIAGRALDDAIQPVVKQMAAVAQAASDTEVRLRAKLDSIGWRWALIMGIVSVPCVLSVFLVMFFLVNQQKHEVQELKNQKAVLQQELGEIQAAIDATKRTAKLRKR